MGTLFRSKALFEALLRVAHDYKLPALVSRDFFPQADYLQPSLGPDDVTIDHMITIRPLVQPDHWAAFYTDAVKSLAPGVTQFIIHLAYDDEEMRAVTIDHPFWGAAWRQRDFDFFTSPAFRRLLDANNVKLVTWREIGKLASDTQPASKRPREKLCAGLEKTPKRPIQLKARAETYYTYHA